jgi:hypothetical protein
MSGPAPNRFASRLQACIKTASCAGVCRRRVLVVAPCILGANFILRGFAMEQQIHCFVRFLGAMDSAHLGVQNVILRVALDTLHSAW